eukprot:327528-Chlamydomonas_euryale.AAC.2
MSMSTFHFRVKLVSTPYILRMRPFCVRWGAGLLACTGWCLALVGSWQALVRAPNSGLKIQVFSSRYEWIVGRA